MLKLLLVQTIISNTSHIFLCIMPSIHVWPQSGLYRKIRDEWGWYWYQLLSSRGSTRAFLTAKILKRATFNNRIFYNFSISKYRYVYLPENAFILTYHLADFYSASLCYWIYALSEHLFLYITHFFRSHDDQCKLFYSTIHGISLIKNRAMN